MPQNIYRTSYQEKQFYNKGFVRKHAEISNEVKQGFFGVNYSNGTIWVLDSTYKYDNDGEIEWTLVERQDKVLTRDEHGNITSVIYQKAYIFWILKRIK